MREQNSAKEWCFVHALNSPRKRSYAFLYPTSETDYNIDNLTGALNRRYDRYDGLNKIV